MTATFTEGQPVRYVGPCMRPGRGTIGTFSWLQDYDLHCGEPLGLAPGFVDADSGAYYCDLTDLEPIT